MKLLVNGYVRILIMKSRLSKAAIQLREQIDDAFPDRDRTSDGWIGDTRHGARKSDHNPDAQGWVRAIDIDRDLSGKAKPDLMPDLVDQVRKACKKGSEKRVAYIIFNGSICSPILRWKWRKYTGANKHTHHAHFSFKKEADLLGEFYQIPMLGGEK
jgi:hypothetical protein